MRTIKNEIISESESEAEERYLKIYYPDSTNFIEVPLDDEDGKLLLIDVKVMEPKIFALNLTSEKRGKLYKPKNGCFKEPKEKWSFFKVVAVLKPSTTFLRVTTFVDDATVVNYDAHKFLPLDLQPKYVISSESEFHTPTPNSCVVEQSLTSNSAFFSEDKNRRKDEILSHNINTSPSMQSGNKSYNTNNSEDLQINDFPRTRKLKIKKRSLPVEPDADKLPVSLVPDTFMNPIQFLPSFDEPSTKKGKKLYNFFQNFYYSEDIFLQLKNSLVIRIEKAKLKLPSKDPLFIEKLIFLRLNVERHPFLKDIFPAASFCNTCIKNLNNLFNIINHILNKQHIISALTQKELIKLHVAVTSINYSDEEDGGYYYKFKNMLEIVETNERKRKRLQAASWKTAASKRHRNI